MNRHVTDKKMPLGKAAFFVGRCYSVTAFFARIALAKSISVALRPGLSARTFCMAASRYGPRMPPLLATKLPASSWAATTILWSLKVRYVEPVVAPDEMTLRQKLSAMAEP